jgi:hypothetical protein
MLGHARGTCVSKTVIMTTMMKILNLLSRKKEGIFLFKLIRLRRRSHVLPRGHNQSHQYLPLKRAMPIPAIMQKGRKYPKIG